MNHIKFVFNHNEFQSETLPDDFPRLCSLVEKILPHIQVTCMKYRDEDNDLVTIANTPDLLEALSQAEKLGQEQLVVYVEGLELTNSFMTSNIREVAQKFSKPTSLLKDDEKDVDFIGSINLAQSIIVEEPAEQHAIIESIVFDVIEESKEAVQEAPAKPVEPLLQEVPLPKIEEIPAPKVEEIPAPKIEEHSKPKAEEVYITGCFKCEGKGIKPKGGACKFCSGSGSVDIMKKPKLRKLLEIIQQEVKEYLPTALDAIRQEDTTVHAGVRCDNCGVVPMVGIRYKCTVCQDFDFCSKCESEVEHAHPFLKIKSPAQIPKTLIVCETEERPTWRCGRGGRKWRDSNPCKRKNRQAEAETRLGCRFVKDVIGRDGDYHKPATSFLKSWRLRNAGAIPWPHGCRLVCVNGDFSGEPVSLPALQPNEEVDVTVQCQAPVEEGRFNSFWRAVDNENTRFGQRIWIMINVGNPIESDCVNQLELLKELCYNDPEKVKAALLEAKGDLNQAVENALN